MHEPVGCKRLSDEIIGTVLNGLHRHRNITVASNQDYWQIGVNGFDPGKELETVDLRHADIGNDNAIILKSNAVQRIQCAWKISNLKTGKLKRLTSGAAERLVIVDKNNGG